MLLYTQLIERQINQQKIQNRVEQLTTYSLGVGATSIYTKRVVEPIDAILRNLMSAHKRYPALCVLMSFRYVTVAPKLRQLNKGDDASLSGRTHHLLHGDEH